MFQFSWLPKTQSDNCNRLMDMLFLYSLWKVVALFLSKSRFQNSVSDLNEVLELWWHSLENPLLPWRILNLEWVPPQGISKSSAENVIGNGTASISSYFSFLILSWRHINHVGSVDPLFNIRLVVDPVIPFSNSRKCSDRTKMPPGILPDKSFLFLR